jgi:hypothetical protein
MMVLPSLHHLASSLVAAPQARRLEQTEIFSDVRAHVHAAIYVLLDMSTLLSDHLASWKDVGQPSTCLLEQPSRTVQTIKASQDSQQRTEAANTPVDSARSCLA